MEPPSDEALQGLYERTPLSRTEYISAIVHLYRGELSRATSWRMRLDNTTNWAVLTTAGLLSIAFKDTATSHLVPLVGLVLIGVFWSFEARRYRFADIWYARVRKIEENFYGPILRRDPVSPERGWGDLVAEDLFRPRFKISRLGALRARLVRNYWALFLVQILAWVVKVTVHPGVAHSLHDLKERLGDGILAWWFWPSTVSAFALGLIGLVLFTPRAEGDEHDHWTISP